MNAEERALNKPNSLKVIKLPHHVQQTLCTTRPPYRQGRKLTAIKAYSVNDESVYLIVTHIPDIKIEHEFHTLCCKYGKVVQIAPLPDYPNDQFEVTYMVKYLNLKMTRFAKKWLDGKNFYGGVLHAVFAPELETVEETCSKLYQRQRAVDAYSAKFSETTDIRQINERHKYSYIPGMKKMCSEVIKLSSRSDKFDINELGPLIPKNLRPISNGESSSPPKYVYQNNTTAAPSKTYVADDTKKSNFNETFEHQNKQPVKCKYIQKRPIFSTERESNNLAFETNVKHKKLVSMKISSPHQKNSSRKGKLKTRKVSSEQPSIQLLQQPVHLKNILP